MSQAQTSFSVPVLISDHNPKAKKPTVAEQLLAWFKDNSPTDDFGFIIRQTGLLKQIVAYENERRTARASKNHPHKRLFDIEIRARTFSLAARAALVSSLWISRSAWTQHSACWPTSTGSAPLPCPASSADNPGR